MSIPIPTYKFPTTVQTNLFLYTLINLVVFFIFFILRISSTLNFTLLYFDFLVLFKKKDFFLPLYNPILHQI